MQKLYHIYFKSSFCREFSFIKRLITPLLSIILFCLTYSKSYGQSTGNWSQLQDMSVKRSSMSIAALNVKLYVIGGEGTPVKAEDPNYLNIVEEYNPVLDEWNTKQNLPIPLSCSVAATFNNKIYVFGGQTTGFKDTNLVFEYDPVTDNWLKKSDAPRSFFVSSAIVFNGKIYIGQGDYFYTYNPEDDKWSTVKLNRTLPVSCALAVINNKIWCISGGQWGKETTEVIEYDETNNSWNRITDLPIARSEHSVVVLDNELYVLGGCNPIDLLIKNLERLDNTAYTWEKLDDMPAKLHFPGVQSLNGKIYVAGGTFGLYRYSGHQKTLHVYAPGNETSVGENDIESKIFSHSQNYPNPFNPETTNSYQWPVNSKTEVKVFDILGQEIAMLVDKEQNAGSYQIKFDGNSLASGIYLYKITAGNFTLSRKMLILK